MYFDMESLDRARTYKLLASSVVPRPIAWVVTCDQDGKPNAAPYSLFNFFGGFPPVICIGMGLRDGTLKDSLRNIELRKEFVINLVSSELIEEMSITAAPFGPEINELEKAGLETRISEKVAIPRISRSPVALECRLNQVVPVDTTAVIVIGHVAGMHVDDEAVINVDRCYLDASKLDLIGRMESPGWYTHTRDRLSMKSFSA
jgi:flavin reductase (DIM6/NTAB) family NADH-FMN oxidoreductase RutF